MADDFECVDAILLHVVDSICLFELLRRMHRFKVGVKTCDTIHHYTYKDYTARVPRSSQYIKPVR